MGIAKRGAGYQVNLMLNGVRYRYQFPNEEAALTWESEARLAHRLGKPIPPTGLPTKTREGAIRNLGDLLAITAKSEWIGAKSEAKLVRNGELFVEWAGPSLLVTDVTSQMLDAYVAHLRKIGNSGATVNRKLAAVKVMLKKAVHNNVVDRIPYVKMQKEAEASLNYLDFGEEDPILTHLLHRGHDAYYDLVIFLIDTGARIGEARKITYRNLKPSMATFSGRDTKNSKTRYIPLTTRAAAAVERRRQAGTDPDRPFGDIRYGHLRRTLKLVFDQLGGKYEDITQPLHVFRHSCASRLAIKGVDVNRIRAWMDHSSIVTTQRYIKLAPKNLEDVVSVLEGPTSAKDHLKVVE